MKETVISYPIRNGFWRLELKWQRIGRMLLVPIAVILVAIVLPIVSGWHPVVGRSMQPTFPMFGGYFRVERAHNPKTQLRVNDIVFLSGQTLGNSVKRVAKIDSKKGVFVLGDNIDKSADSSFGADFVDNHRKVYIPFDEVVGRAQSIWSITRPLGGWWSWAYLNWSAKDIHQCPLLKRYVAIQDRTKVSIYRSSSREPLFSRNGHFRRWNGDRFELLTERPIALLSVGVDGSSEKISILPRQTGIVPSTSKSLGFDGFAEVNVGDTITLKRRGITVKVVAVKHIKCGNMFGIATIVKIDRMLNPVPTMPEPVVVKRQSLAYSGAAFFLLSIQKPFATTPPPRCTPPKADRRRCNLTSEVL